MKNQAIYLFLIPLFLLSSCGKDFTQLSPISERNSTNFYKTKSDFNTAVNGAYSSLQLDGTYGKNYILELEMRSDNTSNNGGASGLASALEAIDQFNIVTTSNIMEETWSDSYKGISRCNKILASINDANFDSKDQYKGEALFIRALIYYNLAVIFGNIPLKLKPTTSIDRSVNQVSAQKVYTQIISDLKKAADLLPASYSAADVGRATRWAAMALEGKVYLTADKKDMATPVLEDVVNNGPYGLLSNFKDIFGTDNENSKESIFEVQFKKGGIGEGSIYTDIFTPLGSAGGVGGGSAPQKVTQSIHNAYDTSDSRFPTSINDTSGTNQSDWWVPKYASSPSGPLDGSSNWIVMRYADVLLMLAEAEGAPSGYEYINQIRQRAGRNDIDAAIPGTFEEKLLRERRLELAFEGHRWADLLRFGSAKEIMAKQLTQQNGKKVTSEKIHLLFPIPQQEIDASTNLKQNPGY